MGTARLQGMSRNRLLGIVFAACLVFAHRSILALVPRSNTVDPIEAFFFDTDTSVPALHLALFALVLFHRRREIARTFSLPGAPWTGATVVALGLLALGWASRTTQIDLQVDSLVLILAGSGLILGGHRLLERLCLPLTLLWLGRPLPPMLTHHVHEWLQQWTASSAYAALAPFALVKRAGHHLLFNDRYFEVIEGCSGLRLEVTLVTAALVYVAYTSGSRRQSLRGSRNPHRSRN